MNKILVHGQIFLVVCEQDHNCRDTSGIQNRVSNQGEKCKVNQGKS